MDEKIIEIIAEFLSKQIATGGMHQLKTGRVAEKLLMMLDREGYKIVKKDSNFQSSLVEEMEDLGMIKEERADKANLWMAKMSEDIIANENDIDMRMDCLKTWVEKEIEELKKWKEKLQPHIERQQKEIVFLKQEIGGLKKHNESA